MIAALPLVTSALSSVFSSGQAPSSTATASLAGADPSFSSVLASFSKDAVNKMNSAETTSADGIQGKATTQSVVESVMQAQEALQTALAVRDKAVSAFQDITRMSI
jgi:flagellar hook-basal body complex protein FliE